MQDIIIFAMRESFSLSYGACNECKALIDLSWWLCCIWRYKPKGLLPDIGEIRCFCWVWVSQKAPWFESQNLPADLSLSTSGGLFVSVEWGPGEAVLVSISPASLLLWSSCISFFSVSEEYSIELLFGVDKFLSILLSLSSRGLSFLCIEEFQWFLIELSVLPTIALAKSAHRFPWTLWWRKRSQSSSSLQGAFLISGLRWLCHLSLHCLPSLPGRLAAIEVHFSGPNLWTNLNNNKSSSSVQGSLLLGQVLLRDFSMRLWAENSLNFALSSSGPLWGKCFDSFLQFFSLDEPITCSSLLIWVIFEYLGSGPDLGYNKSVDISKRLTSKSWRGLWTVMSSLYLAIHLLLLNF